MAGIVQPAHPLRLDAPLFQEQIPTAGDSVSSSLRWRSSPNEGNGKGLAPAPKDQ